MIDETSNSNYDLGITKLIDYIQHNRGGLPLEPRASYPKMRWGVAIDWKIGPDGKYSLRLINLFKYIDDFIYVSGEVMVDKDFEIIKMYNVPRRFYDKCKLIIVNNICWEVQ